MDSTLEVRLNVKRVSLILDDVGKIIIVFFSVRKFNKFGDLISRKVSFNKFRGDLISRKSVLKIFAGIKFRGIGGLFCREIKSPRNLIPAKINPFKVLH